MEVEEKVEEKVDNESSTCEKATNAVINPVEENMEIAEDDVSNLDDDGVSLEEKANFKLQNKDSTELVTDELDKIKDQVMHAVNEKSNFKLQNKETTELVTDVLDEIQNQVMQDVNENLNSQNKTDPVVANGLNDEPSQNIQENPTMQIHDEIENITSDIINSIIDKVEKEEKSFEELENNSVSQTSLGKHKEDNEDLGSPRSSKRKRVPKKMEFNELKKVESKPAPLIPVQEKIIVETPILWKLADLVWAYVPGHPVWPCMVTLHPEENVFTKMKGSNQRLYHMQFLGDSPERGWVSDLRVFPYTSPDDYGKIIADLAAKAKASKPNKSRFKGSKPANSKKIPRLEIPSRNKDDWDSAVVEIGEAVSCTAEERITKFGYDFKPFLQHLKKHLIDDKGPTPAAVKPSTGKASKISCGAFLKNLKVKETSLKRMKRGSNITLQDLAKNLKYTNVKEHIKSLPKSQPRLNNAIILSMQSSCRKPVDDKVLQDAMFSSYCKKLRPTMAAQNPELTPEQIESLIWIEWEALSNEERLLHQESSDQTPSTSVPDAPKPRSRGRPRKLSPMPTNVVVTKKDKFPCSSCEENYPTMSSLEQHKRWCAGPRQNLANIQPLSHSSLSAQSNKVQSVKLSYKCNQCKDMFYSEVSLNVHEKYCTGGASEKSNKAKQQTPLPKTSTKKKASVSSTEAQDDCASTGSKEEELGLMKKTYFKGPQLGTAKRANICIICELVEDDLLTCTGGCLQSFHPACLKLEVAPPSTDDFVCDDCKNDSHPCSICHKRNTNEELGEIKRCNVPKCGRSYHVTCLHSRKLSIIAGDDEEKINKGDRFSLLNSQRCTLHQCATCASKGGDDNFNNTQTNINKKLMFRCLRCPTAYHSGDECIAAGSLILPGLNIICPEHFKPVKTIPHHQPVHVSCCFVCSKGGELVCCESCPAAFHPTCVELDNLPEGEWFCRDCQFRRRPLFGDIVWVKLGSYRWWPGEITHPNEIPDNIQRLQHGIGEFVVKFFGSNDFFWLNKRRVFAYQEGDKGATKTQSSRGISTVFNKAIKEAQARFEERSQHRQKLKEIKTQKKRPSYKHIKVNKPVGNVQVHVADQSEINRCICKRTDLHPCGPESECLNRMLMFECHPGCCPSGDKCENQRFQKRDYPSSEVFKTSWGGWGLRTKVDIKKGEFVNEYVGELVDSEECLRRIEHAHKNNVTNFYMLTIDKDRIIDAGPKGNYSRFMNHCCDPTCETQKWTINGDTRVGLFARNNLKGGDELTFNYNLDCLGNDKTPCMCGSQNCSGFIGVRPKPQINGQNGSRQKIKKKKRLEVRLVPKHDDFCFRCRDLGTLVCCDVRGCERAFCLSCLRLSKPPFGKWECPWHHCDFCGRRSQSFCHFCPNSFCGSHVRNQLFPSMPNKYDCCTDHDPKVAEYDMEEAISNAVQAMLPQEHWNDSLEVKEDSTPSPTLAGNSSNVKSSPLPQQPVVQKRGRPKKIVNGGTPDTTVKSNQEAIDSDSDDLVPLTSSPVKRKRAKKQNHKRNKRLKSTLVNKAKEAVIKSTDALAEISTTSNAGEVNLKPESI